MRFVNTGTCRRLILCIIEARRYQLSDGISRKSVQEPKTILTHVDITANL